MGCITSIERKDVLKMATVNLGSHCRRFLWYNQKLPSNFSDLYDIEKKFCYDISELLRVETGEMFILRPTVAMFPTDYIKHEPYYYAELITIGRGTWLIQPEWLVSSDKKMRYNRRLIKAIRCAPHKSISKVIS